jgi:uncharacterized protein (TIGR03435 family)
MLLQLVFHSIVAVFCGATAMQRTLIFFGMLLLAESLPAQTTRPAFEVASIKPSVNAPRQAVAAAGQTDGAQFRIRGLTIKDYISLAYGLKLNQISAPDWMTTDRFDIVATLPERSGPSQVPEMMQALLEDRFELKSHREKKDFPVYALRITPGGLKAVEVPPEPGEETTAAKASQTFTRSGSGQGISVDLGHGSSFNFANNKFAATKVTMASLAGMLERFVDRPVLDMTEVNGSYDVAFDLAPEDYRVMLIRAAVAAGLVMSPDALRVLDGSPSPATLFEGIAKFGLRLESRRSPLDMLVVDSARKTPTEN